MVPAVALPPFCAAAMAAVAKSRAARACGCERQWQGSGAQAAAAAAVWRLHRQHLHLLHREQRGVSSVR